MEKTLSPKDRKRLARLRREVAEMDAAGYKHDGDESWVVAGERLNNRYFNAINQIKRLTK